MNQYESNTEYVFASGKHMLKTIWSNEDLYNPYTGQYVFLYNEAGSVCVYYIDPEEAEELEKLASEHNDYWGGFLGPGGSIYDDPSYEYYTDEQVSNLDYCEEYYSDKGWMSTKGFKMCL